MLEARPPNGNLRYDSRLNAELHGNRRAFHDAHESGVDRIFLLRNHLQIDEAKLELRRTLWERHCNLHAEAILPDVERRLAPIRVIRLGQNIDRNSSGLRSAKGEGHDRSEVATAGDWTDRRVGL